MFYVSKVSDSLDFIYAIYNGIVYIYSLPSDDVFNKEFYDNLVEIILRFYLLDREDEIYLLINSFMIIDENNQNQIIKDLLDFDFSDYEIDLIDDETEINQINIKKFFN